MSPIGVLVHSLHCGYSPVSLVHAAADKLRAVIREIVI